MFLNVKIITNRQDFSVLETDERTINTNAIALITTVNGQYSFKERTINVNKVRLIDGDIISVIGEFVYNNGEITGIIDK